MTDVRLSYAHGRWRVELAGHDVTSEIAGIDLSVDGNRRVPCAPQITLRLRPGGVVDIDGLDTQVDLAPGDDHE